VAEHPTSPSTTARFLYDGQGSGSPAGDSAARHDHDYVAGVESGDHRRHDDDERRTTTRAPADWAVVNGVVSYLARTAWAPT